MIRIDPGVASAPAAQRWALDILVDLAALLRVEDPTAPVVSVAIVGGGRGSGGAAESVSGARGRGWGLGVEDGGVTVDGGVLALVASMASAADEQRSEQADRHGRVPPERNLAVREGVEREPVLHEAAGSLRRAIVAAAGRRPVRFLAPWPDGRRWAVAITHDVDVVAAWPAFAAMRWLELIRGGHGRRAGRAVSAAASAALGSPVPRAVERVLAVEAAHGVRASWFFLCGTPTARSIRRGDLTYRPESRAARDLMDMVGAAGHEIGLHGSFDTWRDAAALAAQRARLASLTGKAVLGVRQHFLRMRPGETQRAMRDAGFHYDATFGFSDRNGFRLGVADVVGGFLDVGGDEVLPLDIVPLVWMDRALSKYRGIENPDAWVDEALALAAAARDVRGLWTGLWHPNLTDALGYPDAPEAFRRLIGDLVAQEPFVAPAAELVAWRAARRAVRITSWAPEADAVEFRPPADGRIMIVDHTDRPDSGLSRRLHSPAAGPRQHPDRPPSSP